MPVKKKSSYISKVESIATKNSGQELRYSPTEKVNVIIVPNFPMLGKLTALRFMEWIQNNENGVVSLPTGKTPEHFIKWVTHFLNSWDLKETKNVLEESGVDPSKKPNMKNLHFVQIDEFYPINTQQYNSFYYYVNKYYIKGFGLDPKKALLINPNSIGIPAGESIESIWPNSIVDLDLRVKQAKNAHEARQKRVLEAVDQFCTEYESKIRSLGGIGFFLGGIGPDGHIGFNVKGSDHFSTTRLTPTNYETQAAAASDLGGIEISRRRLVITVGLRTIVFNPDAIAIIIASGEAKATIVKQAIQENKSNDFPATVLQDLKNSCFYLTSGAAKLLTERSFFELKKNKKISELDKHRIVIDLALFKEKTIKNLTVNDLKSVRSSNLLLEQNQQQYKNMLLDIEQEMQDRFSSTLEIPTNKTFFHTAPHHDDIMLGYLPYLIRLIRESTNTHFFNYLTSGFTAVTNKYMYNIIKRLKWFVDHSDFKSMAKQNFFDPQNITARNQDVLLYLDGVAANRHLVKEKAESQRLLRNMIEIYEEDSFSNLNHRIDELLNYFKTQYPGKKDLAFIQQLKGMTREWEADLLWGYFGFNCSSVIHSRLGFYKGDIFTEEPEMNRDVVPILKNLKSTNPDVATVALDPEGSGPDTHYKVLQAVSEALKIYSKDCTDCNIEVWGYRNVWYRFHPSEATAFVPVTLNTFAIMQNAFMKCFGSQAEASFPSHEYDGPFSLLAQRIQVEQYQMLNSLLGQSFFYESPDSRTRSTRGLVLLKKMNLEEFFRHSEDLKKSAENV